MLRSKPGSNIFRKISIWLGPGPNIGTCDKSGLSSTQKNVTKNFNFPTLTWMGSFLTFLAGLGIGGGSCSFLISSFGSSLTCGDELFEFRAVRRGFDVLELFGFEAARSGFGQGSEDR